MNDGTAFPPSWRGAPRPFNSSFARFALKENVCGQNRISSFKFYFPLPAVFLQPCLRCIVYAHLSLLAIALSLSNSFAFFAGIHPASLRPVKRQRAAPPLCLSERVLSVCPSILPQTKCARGNNVISVISLLFLPNKTNRLTLLFAPFAAEQTQFLRFLPKDKN